MFNKILEVKRPHGENVAREYYKSQRDRFQNPARFAHVKRKRKKKDTTTPS